MAVSLAATMIVLALLIVAAGWRMQRRTGLPLAEVVYTDTQAGERPDRPFFSPTYRLAGRPDYLLQLEGQTIPVEVKPSRSSSTPYAADILQLLAYCLLVEEERERPPYGLLRYKEHTFRIDYTETARNHLIERIEEVRAARYEGEQDRSHDEPGRCRACGYRDMCDQSLAER